MCDYPKQAGRRRGGGDVRGVGGDSRERTGGMEATGMRERKEWDRIEREMKGRGREIRRQSGIYISK